MEEPTQQPKNNSKRQADSIETEAELDAAILAAIERANEAHGLELPVDDTLNEPLFADDPSEVGYLLGALIEPSYEREYQDLSPQFPISPDGNIDEEFSVGMMPAPFHHEYEDKDLSSQSPISPPVEEVKLPQPQSDDAVLGGQNPTLASSGVLGGLEGVKRRLTSTAVEAKIVALKEAVKYGQAGIDLVVQALKNETKVVAQSAYFLLRDSSKPMAQQALQEYNPYRFFECTFSGRLRNSDTYPIVISPDGETLVCGSHTDIILWNLHTGKWLRTLKGHSHSVNSVVISPDGQTLVTGSQDGRIKLWNLSTAEELHTWKEHSHWVNSIAISPDGQTLVTGSRDGTIKRWDLSTSQELQTLKGYSSQVNFLAISPDNLTLVSHGADLTGGGGRTRSIKLWNLHTGKERTTLKKHSCHCVAISSDNLTLISGGRDKSIKLWNLHTGEERNTIKAYARPSEFVSALAISPDGQTLFSGSHCGTIKLWNIATGKLLHTIEGHSSHISSIAISPDGQTLVSGSHDGTIKVWGWR